MILEIFAHLWQSTVFAGAAWLAALALRKNRAQARYWIWFTASVKFLVPFSLLVRVGTLLPHGTVAPLDQTQWAAALQEISQPFTLPAVAARVAAPSGAADHSYFPVGAVALWACGFAAVTICWWLRWRRVRAVRKAARAVRISTALEIPVPVMSSPDLTEPGVFGVLRPVLLLPEGIAGQLTPTQLDAILAHEFCHVRRRDNLMATIHMAVQAIFWFHPVAWWMGARLIDERERACDEEVLRRGCRPDVYAESILTICKLYLSSPLACVSGVTGSNLQKRIEAIMKNRDVVRLNLGKRLALTAAGMAALVVPTLLGMLHAPAIQAQDAPDWQTAAGGKMSFDVASIKLSKGAFVPPNMGLNAGEGYRPTGGYFRADYPLWTYLQFAYKMAPAEEQSREMLTHLPKWATTDRYSIDARGAANASKDQMRLMVQSLLAERFKLAAHFETREFPVFNLTLVKAGALGPKLRSRADGAACDAAVADGPTPARIIRGDAVAGPENFPPMCDSFAVIRKAGGAVMLGGYRNATMDMVAASLGTVVGQGRPVINKTGLGGRFDFTIEWAPDSNGPPSPATAAAPPDPVGPTSLQALHDQLGLKLESGRGPVKILIVDAVERPSEN